MAWYKAGTISVSGKTVTGAGTNWTDNKMGIGPGQALLIPGTGSVKMYEIARVDSATKITLASDAGTVSAGSAYAIMSFYTDSVPDFARRLAVQLSYYQSQMDGWQQIMTGTGSITLEAPDDTIVTISSFKKLTDDMNNKLDAGATQPVFGWGVNVKNPDNSRTGYLGSSSGNIGSGTVYLVNRQAGKSLELHDDGVLSYGGRGNTLLTDAAAGTLPRASTRTKDFNSARVGWDTVSTAVDNSPISGNVYGTVFSWCDQGHRDYKTIPVTPVQGEWWHQIFYNTAGKIYYRFRTNASAWSAWQPVYNGFNTTKASDGTLKAASPVCRIVKSQEETARADVDEEGFSWCGAGTANGEAAGIAITRQDVGVYEITGAAGLAGDGWRLLPPRDPNGSGDLGIVEATVTDSVITVRLYKRRWQLTDDGDIEPVRGAPMDVPANSWIDVRLSMPTNHD